MQNTSSAVMQQRRDKARASLDDFPTPPHATRAAIVHVLGALGWRESLHNYTATDPCCNRGHMVRPLCECFGKVYGTDIADYARDPLRAGAEAGGLLFEQNGIGDFLWDGWAREFRRAAEADWFFMNPPFKLAEAFIHRALGLARVGVAVFIRSAFPEGQGRYERLFRDTPPTVIAYHSERVILHEGVLRDPEVDYWDPKMNDGKGGWRTPSTATGSIWMVWLKSMDRQPALWIPPCRKLLTRPGDYPANPDQKGVFVPPAAVGQGALI